LKAKQDKTLLIGIVGPTGSGKSTLANGLGKLLKFEVHREVPEDNPYWHEFYDDLNQGVRPSVNAFGSQLTFMVAAVEQARKGLVSSTGGVVWDVTPVGHKMYADLQHEQGILSDRDYKLYCRIFDGLVAGLPDPDVMLVVNVDKVEVLLERIHLRGRKEEMETPAEYWQKQIGYWEEKLAANGGKMVAVSSVEVDWRKPEGVRRVWRRVEGVLNS